MIELTAGELTLSIDPDLGGAITRFTCGDFPLLRPVSDTRLAAQKGRAVAAYPLIPFANRVGFGVFSLDGREHYLRPNFGDHPHPIHGNAWMHAWQANGDLLRFDFQPDDETRLEWPFAYRAEQHFMLDEDGLTVAISVENTDAQTWPAGIGLHPYIAREGATFLCFNAKSVWSNGANALPDRRENVQGHWDFSTARALGDAQIDECYAGWDGSAQIEWLDAGIALRIDAEKPFGHLQLYTPPGNDFFGLEPVSNMPDAINRRDVPDNGLRMLKPGDRISGIIRFSVEPR